MGFEIKWDAETDGLTIAFEADGEVHRSSLSWTRIEEMRQEMVTDLAREVLKLRRQREDLVLAAMRFLNLSQRAFPPPAPWNATPSKLGEAEATLGRLLDAALPELEARQ